MDVQLRRAIGGSHLRGVPDDVLDRLLAGAVRALVTAPDGRTLTVRYCRPGDLLGAMSLFSSGFTMPASVQALVETRVLRTDPAVVRSLVRQPDVAHALILELSERARGFLHEIPDNAFATVRQRVVRHLLDLAGERRTAGGEPIVSASQQEVADAAGTVREVVVRVLRELRGEGLVRTGRGEIVLTDVARLVDEGPRNLGS